MTARVPTTDELARIANQYRFELSTKEIESFQEVIGDVLASCNRLDEMTEPTLPLKYPKRDLGYRPQPEDNPFNAFYWRASVKGAESGKLQGKKIVAKDSVAVAGLPMMNGSAVLEGFIPDYDATVVTRILEAGGEIIGKAVCEDLSFSGSSFTPATGPVGNPHDRTRSAGGSSTGCGPLLVTSVADMAIASDQGGSTRIPAAWCGLAGIKATVGLVPYTGQFSLDITLDHCGSLARTVADAALLLEVMAGEDGLDPRQHNVRVADSYTKNLTGEADGLRVGIVKEGFGWSVSEPDVDKMVRDAAQKLKQVGATVSDVSIPMHRDGVHIWQPIGMEGVAATMIQGCSRGMGWQGFYSTQLVDAFGRGWHAQPNSLAENAKMAAMIGQYLKEHYNGRYYTKAQNLRRSLRDAYDRAFEKYDVLVMPTIPFKATKLPPANVNRKDYVDLTLNMIQNTGAFNLSGHPAISINTGFSKGLPVGMMIIGRYWEEPTVLRVAHAFEQANQQSVRVGMPKS
jgi:amidase